MKTMLVKITLRLGPLGLAGRHNERKPQCRNGIKYGKSC